MVNKILDDLNEEQKQAVLYTKGPLLIIAGAGTGKTTVITRKIAYLILEKGLKEDEILAVTFTEKAASEMEERVDMFLPYGYVDLWISTFHSFCQRVLEEKGIEIGIPPNFKILSPSKQYLLIRENLDRFNLKFYKPISNPTKFIQSLLNLFSKAKDELIMPEDYLKYVEELKLNKEKFDVQDDEYIKKQEEIAIAYKTYQEILLENEALDFGDLLCYTVILFKKRPQILKEYQTRFKYIMIDEFQDTNWVQYELIKLLSQNVLGITAVADDDQSIYRWRGASLSNVLQFKKDFPNTKEVVLTKNYRSYQNILDLAYKFIQYNNPNRLEYQINQAEEIKKQAEIKGIDLTNYKSVSKKLIAQNIGKGIIELIYENSIEEEIEQIIKKILEIKEKEKIDYNSFAILIRANENADIFIKKFENYGIPYIFFAARGLYKKRLILNLIAFLKIIVNSYDEISFYRILYSDLTDFNSQEIIKILHLARKKAIKIYDVLKNLNSFQEFEDTTIKKALNFLNLLHKYQDKIYKQKPSRLIYSLLDDLGIIKEIIKKEKGTLKEKIWVFNQVNYLKSFFKKIELYENESKDPNLKEFLELINYEIESGNLGELSHNIEEGPDGIKILTIHSAKGLEFDYVFIPNLVDKKFPTINRRNPLEIPDDLIKEVLPSGDIHLQEERRLFYVALTRAKKGVFLSLAKDYGGLRPKKPSRFLFELGLVKKTDKKEIKKLNFDFLIKPEIKIEKNFKTKIPIHSNFSFTQLEAFKRCPLQYKYQFILKVPTAGRHTYSFGKSLHNTLYEIYRRIKERSIFGKRQDLFQKQNSNFNNNDKADFNIITLDEILKILDEKWIDDWYESETHKKSAKEKAVEILKNLVERNKTGWKIPLKLETGFSFKIGKYTIKGRIDRIDKLEDGVELIDYKTGNPKNFSEVEKDQLLIYQIASSEILKLKPVKLTFVYLDNFSEISFLGTNEEIEKIKKDLVKRIEDILNSDFPPNPGFHCQFCDFKHICEYANL